MRNVRLAAVVAAALLTSVPSLAMSKEYGDAGTFEVGGQFHLGSSTKKYDKADVKIEMQDTTIQPNAGFFVTDSIQVIGDLTISNYKVDDTDGNRFALGVGAGYLLKVGALRVGPEVLVRYYNEKFGDTTENGPGAALQGALKVPIGTGGLLTASAGLSFFTATAKSGGAKDDVTTQSFDTLVGFAIWF